MLHRVKFSLIFTFKLILYIILKPLCLTAVFFFQFSFVWGYKKKKYIYGTAPSFTKATLVLVIRGFIRAETKMKMVY